MHLYGFGRWWLFATPACLAQPASLRRWLGSLNLLHAVTASKSPLALSRLLLPIPYSISPALSGIAASLKLELVPLVPFHPVQDSPTSPIILSTSLLPALWTLGASSTLSQLPNVPQGTSFETHTTRRDAQYDIPGPSKPAELDLPESEACYSCAGLDHWWVERKPSPSHIDWQNLVEYSSHISASFRIASPTDKFARVGFWWTWVALALCISVATPTLTHAMCFDPLMHSGGGWGH